MPTFEIQGNYTQQQTISTHGIFTATVEAESPLEAFLKLAKGSTRQDDIEFDTHETGLDVYDAEASLIESLDSEWVCAVEDSIESEECAIRFFKRLHRGRQTDGALGINLIDIAMASKGATIPHALWLTKEVADILWGVARVARLKLTDPTRCARFEDIRNFILTDDTFLP